MKDSVVGILSRALDNKHTSTSAIFLFAATVIGVIWPKYKAQADEIARAAIVYGLVMAGDSKPSGQTPGEPMLPTPAQREQQIADKTKP